MRQPTAAETTSRHLFGNMHFASVTYWVSLQPIGEVNTFRARQIAEAAHITSTSVEPVLGRLVTASLITAHEPGEWTDGDYDVPYSRIDNKVWQPLHNLCAAVLGGGLRGSSER